MTCNDAINMSDSSDSSSNSQEDQSPVSSFNLAALDAAADGVHSVAWPSLHSTAVQTGTVDPPRKTATPPFPHLRSSEKTRVVVPEWGLTPLQDLWGPIKEAAVTLANVSRGIIDCGGNGNCGARCLVYAFLSLGWTSNTDLQSSARGLRKEITDYLARQQGHVLPDGMTSIANTMAISIAAWDGPGVVQDKEKTAAGYLKHMANPHTYLDEVALQAVCDIRNVNIRATMVSRQGKSTTSLRPRNSRPVRATIHLVCHAGKHFVLNVQAVPVPAALADSKGAAVTTAAGAAVTREVVVTRAAGAVEQAPAEARGAAEAADAAAAAAAEARVVADPAEVGKVSRRVHFSTPEAFFGAAAGGEEEEVPREQSALEKEAAADSDSSISSEVSSDSGSDESDEEGASCEESAAGTACAGVAEVTAGAAAGAACTEVTAGAAADAACTAVEELPAGAPAGAPAAEDAEDADDAERRIAAALAERLAVDAATGPTAAAAAAKVSVRLRLLQQMRM